MNFKFTRCAAVLVFIVITMGLTMNSSSNEPGKNFMAVKDKFTLLPPNSISAKGWIQKHCVGADCSGVFVLCLRTFRDHRGQLPVLAQILRDYSQLVSLPRHGSPNETRRAEALRPPSHQIDRAVRSFHGMGVQNLEESRKRLLETLLRVGGKDILPRRQQDLDLRIALRNELDDQVFSQAGEIAGNPSQRNVVGNRDVMDQREGHHQICRTPLCERKALLVSPSECGTRIHEIHDEREQMGFLGSARFAVVALDASRIDIEGDGVDPSIGRDTAEATRVGS